jgi:hypothetical protein
MAVDVSSEADLVAQPYFPTPLSQCTLSHAAITGTVLSSNATAIRLEITANTTAPYVFLSSTLPGRFSDNSFTLLPNQPSRLVFEIDAPPVDSVAPVADDAAAVVAGWIDAVRVYSMNNKAPTSGSVVFRE